MSRPEPDSVLAVLGEHRATVLRRLAELQSEMAALRVDRAAESADDEHDPEGVTLSAEWSRLEGLRAAAIGELSDIDGALARVVDGTYGVCIDCGCSIPPGRLEARPTATRCVGCAERAGR